MVIGGLHYFLGGFAGFWLVWMDGLAGFEL